MNGTLKSDISGANIYFFNSNGIIFGEKFNLDISGSFNVSTADYLRLGSSDYYYSDAVENEKLSKHMPEAFGFSDSNIESIIFEDSVLEYLNQNQHFNESISIVSGGISIINSTINITDGMIHLASVASQGEVIIPSLEEKNTDSYTVDTFGQVEIKNSELVSHSGDQLIVAGKLIIADQSSILSDEHKKENTIEFQVDTIELLNDSQILNIANNEFNSGGIRIISRASFSESQPSLKMNNSKILSGTTQSGKAGNISIDAKHIQIDSSVIDSDSKDKGNAGDISIINCEVVSFNNSYVHSESKGTSENSGCSGNISIFSSTASFSNGSVISTDSILNNLSADIRIITSNSLSFVENSSIISKKNVVLSSNEIRIDSSIINVNEGNINIINSGDRENTLDIIEKGILTETHDFENYGTTLINSSDLITESGNQYIFSGDLNITNESSIIANTTTRDNNKIELHANTIQIDNESQISNISLSDNQSAGVNIISHASYSDTEPSFTLNNSKILSTAQSNGNAGRVVIDTKNALITDSEINANTENTGHGGNISLINCEKILLDNNSSILSESGGKSENAGNTGSIFLNSSYIDIKNASFLSTSTHGSGVGNEIKIVSDNSITIDGGFIRSKSFGRLDNAGSSGEISLESPTVELLNKSEINTDTDGPGNGGNISIITDKCILDMSQISSSVKESGSGKAGTISVNFFTEIDNTDEVSITLQNDSNIESENLGKGQPGEIVLKTGNFIVNRSVISSSNSIGKSGKIILEAYGDCIINEDSMILANSNTTNSEYNQMIIDTDARKSINIDVGSSFEIQNKSQISSATKNYINAGDIHIHAGDISISDGKIQAPTSGTGDAGNIVITADDQILFSNDSEIQAQTNNLGNAGDIFIKAGNKFYCSVNSRINTATYSEGNGGKIDIIATNSIVLNQSIVDSSTTKTGRAGIINFSAENVSLDNQSFIKSKSANATDSGKILMTNNNNYSENISLKNNSEISTSSIGSCKPGDIEILAKKIQLESKTSIVSESDFEGSSKGTGQISINDFSSPGEELTLTDSLISTTSKGESDAGDILISAEKIELSKKSEIISNSNNRNAGNINIDSHKNKIRLTMDDSKITTNSSFTGNGGNITLPNLLYLLMNNSNIETKANTGKGGTVSIFADQLIQSFNSIIDVSSLSGPAGKEEVKTLDTDISGDLVIFEPDLFNIDELLNDPCVKVTMDKVSELIIKKREGFSSTPDSYQEYLPLN